jgi:DNA-binding SARP family transcriptional activator
MLWPERPPRDPQGALRPILSRLRAAVAPAAIEGRDRLRLLLPAPVWLDLDEATRGVEAARTAARRGSWEEVCRDAEAAVELLPPGLLPGRDGDWLDARRREVEELFLEALELLARGVLAVPRPDVTAAERASRELIARSPYRETGYRYLMEALAASGNVAEALRVYEELRVLLRDELGALPAAEVQALHERLLSGKAVPPSERSPAGERRVALPVPLSPRERSAFVGRGRELDALREAWRQAHAGERRLVLVAGEPGIGKTRLTRQFSTEASEGAAVLRAGCQEDALLPYEPFVEALRHHARRLPPEWTDLSLGPGGGELTCLVPELAAALPTEPEIPTGDPETPPPAIKRWSASLTFCRMVAASAIGADDVRAACSRSTALREGAGCQGIRRTGGPTRCHRALAQLNWSPRSIGRTASRARSPLARRSNVNVKVRASSGHSKTMRSPAIL